MSDDNNGNWKLTGNSGTNPANNFLGTKDGQPLVIRTNAVERVRITAGGNVGIGTPTPTQQLQITANELLPTAVANTSGNLFFGGDTSAGTNGLRLFSLDGAGGGFIDVNASSTDKGILFRADTSNGGTERMRITAGGNVGIGTATPGLAFRLDVAGAAHASSFPVSSDARLKTDVKPLTNVLEKLEKIRGVSFEWNELCESLGRSTGHTEIGVIAQEVEAVFPELVTTWGDESYKGVDYGRLTGILIESVKELRAENKALEQRLKALEQT